VVDECHQSNGYLIPAETRLPNASTLGSEAQNNVYALHKTQKAKTHYAKPYNLSAREQPHLSASRLIGD
jgi:hypothetical protein